MPDVQLANKHLLDKQMHEVCRLVDCGIQPSVQAVRVPPAGPSHPVCHLWGSEGGSVPHLGPDAGLTTGSAAEVPRHAANCTGQLLHQS